MEVTHILSNFLVNVGYKTNPILMQIIIKILILTQCKILNYNSHYSDANTLLQTVLEDDTNSFEGKKFMLEGPEKLSFSKIDDIIKQTYFKGEKFNNPEKFTKILMNGWNMLYNGNNHLINFEKMIEFYSLKNGNNEGYENLAKTLSFQTKNMSEHYNSRAGKDILEDLNNLENNVNSSKSILYPLMTNYEKISLN